MQTYYVDYNRDYYQRSDIFEWASKSDKVIVTKNLKLFQIKLDEIMEGMVQYDGVMP